MPQEQYVREASVEDLTARYEDDEYSDVPEDDGPALPSGATDELLISYVVNNDALEEVEQSYGIDEDDFQGEYRTIWRYLARTRREHGAVPSKAVVLGRFPELELPVIRATDVPVLVAQLKQRTKYSDVLKVLDTAARACTSHEAADEVIQQLEDGLALLRAAPDEADDESWQELDLTAALNGAPVAVVPTVLKVGHTALFYPARVNGLHGDSGDGKTWAVYVAAAEEMYAGNHVVWIDFEDNEGVAIERLRGHLRVDQELILERFHYLRPPGAFDSAAVNRVLAIIETYEPTLLVIDSLGEAFATEGINEDKDAEVGPWLRRVTRPLADAGPAIVVIDHSTKSKDNPLFPSGSKRKRAAITGASYLLSAPQPLSRAGGGTLRLTCAKDRHGNFRRGERVAEIELRPQYDEADHWQYLGLRATVDSAADERDTADARLNRAADAAVRALRDIGRPMSQRELREAMNITASTEQRIAGIERAVALGAIRVEQGPRNAQLHHYVQEIAAGRNNNNDDSN
jgi:hypothetical protein